MPRQSRIKSESGIYHIILRGINKQQIFEDDEDFQKFISVLKDCKAISEFKLFAYCLMGNHIHLLIKPEKEALELIFKRIGSRYVYWYNWKYHRTGHLFQDRYKAKEIIEKYSQCRTIAEFQKLDPKLRDEYIAIFKQSGLSIRQISRLTGISFGIVRKRFE